MSDSRVTITCDLDQAIAAKNILIDWLNQHGRGFHDGQEATYRLVDEFDDLIHEAIWSPDYE